MNTDFFDIICDKEKLKKELVFYSLFLMMFENFVAYWKETTRSYFSNGYAIDDITGEPIDFIKCIIDNGEEKYIKDKDAEKKYNKQVSPRVIRDGKYYPKLSMFKWLADNNIIDIEDFEILDKCYSKRNEYAHNIFYCLEHYVSREEKELLLSLISISEKAARNWIMEIEIPTSSEEELAAFIDEDGNYNPPKDVISGIQIINSLVLSNLKDIFDE